MIATERIVTVKTAVRFGVTVLLFAIFVCCVSGCDGVFPFSKPSEGLEFEIDRESNTCTLIGLGTCTDEDIVIPDEYNGYPVAAIRTPRVVLGGGVEGVFTGDHIRSVTLPNSLTSLDSSVFFGCSSLESIRIPAGVVSIGTDSFGNVGSPFPYCPSLTKITVDSKNPVYMAKGNCVIERGTGRLVAGCVGSVIPEDGSVRSIGAGAFEWCVGLTALHIPESVTDIDDHAVLCCPDLVSITVDENNPVYKAENDRVVERSTGRVIVPGSTTNSVPDLKS